MDPPATTGSAVEEDANEGPASVEGDPAFRESERSLRVADLSEEEYFRCAGVMDGRGRRCRCGRRSPPSVGDVPVDKAVSGDEGDVAVGAPIDVDCADDEVDRRRDDDLLPSGCDSGDDPDLDRVRAPVEEGSEGGMESSNASSAFHAGKYSSWDASSAWPSWDRWGVSSSSSSATLISQAFGGCCPPTAGEGGDASEDEDVVLDAELDFRDGGGE